MFTPGKTTLGLLWWIAWFDLVILISVACKPGWYRVSFSLPVLCMIARLILMSHSDGTFYMRYAIGLHLLMMFGKYVDFVMLGNGDSKHIHEQPCVKKANCPRKSKPATPMWTQVIERLRWSFNLLFLLQRGYGWTHEVQGIPIAKALPRWTFVGREILHFMFMFITFDNAVTWMNVFSVCKVKEEVSFYDVYYKQAWAVQLCASSLAMTASWAFLSMITSDIYITVVGLGIHHPHECPPIWGSWTETYTVKGFWGRGWHQLQGRTASVAGISVRRDLLHMKKGDCWSKCVQLIVKFSTNGLIHCLAAIYACGRDTGEFQFFLLQPLAILLEDFAIRAARDRGYQSNRAWKVVGCLWTHFWILYSSRGWTARHMEEGLLSIPFLNITSIPAPSKYQCWRI